MALDAFLDCNYSRTMPWVSTGLASPQVLLTCYTRMNSARLAVVASLFGKPSRNSPSIDAGISHFNAYKYCNAPNQAAVLSASNLTYSVAESYQVPDGISAVSKDPQLHRTSTTNIDSHVDFFKLPMLSSHDLFKSWTPLKDALSTVQDISYMNGSPSKRKQRPGSLTATSHQASQKHEDSLPHDIKQELHNSCYCRIKILCKCKVR